MLHQLDWMAMGTERQHSQSHEAEVGLIPRTGLLDSAKDCLCRHALRSAQFRDRICPQKIFKRRMQP